MEPPRAYPLSSLLAPTKTTHSSAKVPKLNLNARNVLQRYQRANPNASYAEAFAHAERVACKKKAADKVADQWKRDFDRACVEGNDAVDAFLVSMTTEIDMLRTRQAQLQERKAELVRLVQCARRA